MKDRRAMPAAIKEGRSNDLLKAYNENLDALRRYFILRLRCVETAEDLAQETWLKANQNTCALAAITNPRAYLFTMAANLATDYLRTQSRRAKLREEHQGLLWFDIDTLTPERYVIAQDELDHLGSTLGELRAISRKIFYLNRFSGYTNKQIAAELGISTATVAYHIKLVLDHLAHARDAFGGE